MSNWCRCGKHWTCGIQTQQRQDFTIRHRNCTNNWAETSLHNKLDRHTTNSQCRQPNDNFIEKNVIYGSDNLCQWILWFSDVRRSGRRIVTQMPDHTRGTRVGDVCVRVRTAPQPGNVTNKIGWTFDDNWQNHNHGYWLQYKSACLNDKLMWNLSPTFSQLYGLTTAEGIIYTTRLGK